MSELTIIHTHEDGTLIDGTSRGDGASEILKDAGWRFSRALGSWYIPNSRDRLPKMGIIGGTRTRLEAAGFTVDLDLHENLRPAAEVEAAKIARHRERADAFAEKAARRATEAARADARAQADHDALPEGGEPIKIGHHSEAGHRAALARSDRSTRKSLEAARTAEHAAARAETAARTTDRRYAPVTVANRIERLAAEIRRIEREITADTIDRDGNSRPPTDTERTARADRYELQLTELRDQHEYWVGVRAEQIATGAVRVFTCETIQPGDHIRTRGTWRKVVRANQKTVSVDTGYSWTDKVPYAEITHHRTAEEIARLLAEAEGK